MVVTQMESPCTLYSAVREIHRNWCSQNCDGLSRKLLYLYYRVYQKCCRITNYEPKFNILATIPYSYHFIIIPIVEFVCTVEPPRSGFLRSGHLPRPDMIFYEILTNIIYTSNGENIQHNKKQKETDDKSWHDTRTHVGPVSGSQRVDILYA